MVADFLSLQFKRVAITKNICSVDVTFSVLSQVAGGVQVYASFQSCHWLATLRLTFTLIVIRQMLHVLHVDTCVVTQLKYHDNTNTVVVPMHK